MYTQQLTVIQQRSEWFATNPDGKLPTNQKIERGGGGEEGEEDDDEEEEEEEEERRRR
jgi:hypothetical protein